MGEGFLEQVARHGVVLGDGGYLIELERRGYVDSGSEREKVGTGRGSGQYTPEIAIEHPEALSELHREFLRAGARVLQALTFFGTREKLTRSGYGAQTEAINAAAVRIAREVAEEHGSEQGPALVAGTISRTQLFEREGPSAAGRVRDLLAEQVRLLQGAGVDLWILETFFHLEEMQIALECVRGTGLPVVATMSFRPPLSLGGQRGWGGAQRRGPTPVPLTHCSDGHSPADCARAMVAGGADLVGANCEQEPHRMLPILRAMRDAVVAPLAAQPAAFRTTDETPCFTRVPEFPDALETIQIARQEFAEFARAAKAEGIGYVGGCCGCNAAYVRAMARGLAAEQG